MKKSSNEYEPDIIDFYPNPVDFYKQCLYLRETEFEQICKYKGKKIKLSKILFNALFKMAENTSRYHLFTISYDSDRAIPDNDRKIINRIKKKFKEAGFDINFIKSKEHAGYKIDTEIIPDELVITSKK